MITKCALIKELKEEHAEIKVPQHGTMMVTCPLLSKQICLWCCLHISEVADPLKRTRAVNTHPRYAEVVTKLTGRTLESIAQTCNGCSQAH